MLKRLRERKEWKFFGVLPRADARSPLAWWIVLILRGALPAAFARRHGRARRRRADGRERSPSRSTLVGAVFVLLQVLAPIHTALSANLGDRTAAWLYDRLTEACVRPPGMGHLEDPKLTNDLTVARDFDLGMTGPPLSHLDGLHRRRAGRDDRRLGVGARARRLCVVGADRCWQAPGSPRTGCCVRARVWRDRNTDEVRGAQRDADYAYRLAVDPPASKELRLFGLASWTIDRFISAPHAAARAAVRGHAPAREAGASGALLLVVGANVVVFWSLASDVAAGTLEPRRSSSCSRSAPIGTSMIAFGGLNWALDGAAAPVAAVLRLEPAMAPAGALPSGQRDAAGMPAREIRFRDVTFAYPAAARRCSTDFDLTIPAGIVARDRRPERRRQDDARQAAVPPVRPAAGAIEVDGVDMRELDLASWRSRVTAVFQDFIRFELPLRDNVAPAGAPDDAVRAALESAGAADLAGLDTVLARGYEGGTDLSGGQWQRVALARALCAVQLGAGRRAARRADRAARRARRGRDLRAHPRRDAPLHDDPDLASLLDRAPRRPHLRARARAGRRARHARRADGARRPLSHDVRPAGAALRRGRRRGGHDV